MALGFEATGDVLRIDQTRRPLKLFMWLCAFGAIGGTINGVLMTQRGETHGIGPILGPALGCLLMIVLCGMFLVETHVVVDRRARTIAMRGLRWPRKRWNIERSLSEVEAVFIDSYYVGKGQRNRLIMVRFTDAEVYEAFSPAASMVATIEERLATLKQFCGVAH